MTILQTKVGGLWCAEVLERLDAYVDGSLPVAEKKAVEAHVQQCLQCAQFGKAYSAIVSSIREQVAASPLTNDDEASLDRVRKRLSI